MSLPKKGRRTIVVRDRMYYWHFGGYCYLPDDWLTQDEQIEGKELYRLRIEAADFMRYHLVANINSTYMWDPDFLYLYSNLIIKPRLVRQVIEAALDHGWNPETAREHLVLDNVENLIEA